MRPVAFKNADGTIAGNLHIPMPFDDSKKYPAILFVLPSAESAKAAADYGAKLTATGFVTLVSDAISLGAATGGLRNVECPADRVENIRCAIDYLVTMQFVDEDRIAIVGIGAGGGYAVSAAMSDYRISAIAAVAPVNFGRVQREGDLSSGAAAQRLREIAQQRTAEARGADPRIVSLMPVSTSDQNGPGSTLELVEATDVPAGNGTALATSTSGLRLAHLGAAFVFDAFHLAEELLVQPLLVTVGDVDGPLGSYRDSFQLFDRARSDRKKLQVRQNCRDDDFYERGDVVDAVVHDVGEFLKGGS